MSTVETDPGARVLVVAREALTTELCNAIAAAGLCARGVRAAADAPNVAAEWRPAVVLVDAELTDPTAGEVVERVKQRGAGLCALLTADPSSVALGEALRAGADTVLSTPLEIASLHRLVRQEGAPARDSVHALELSAFVLGSSAQMRQVWRLVFRAAQSDASVLVLGETGAGKEVVARALHRFSARRNGPFVAVNCAALPAALLESELFGHEKGAFTGAASRHRGRFELADGGTLLLDEIGDLPLSLQVKILRVIQERTFERVGGSEPISVDLRLIAATHRNLDDEVRRERFRSDLYYRLNVLSVPVPALRQRKADIIPLWDHFVAEAAAREHIPLPRTSPSVHRILLAHDWPGNVRELQNAALHALTVATGDWISPADLPAQLHDRVEHDVPEPRLVGMTMKEVERALIRQTYEALGTVTATAAMLGISARKIHYRLKEYRGKEPGAGVAGVPGEEAGVGDGSGSTPLRDAARRQLRVLLAEDDDEVRWALADFLRTEGHEVVAVRNGNALLAHLAASMLLEHREAPPDLIITDLRMPGFTGMDLLEGVRARGWTVPIVVMTAFGDRDTRERARELGAAAFFDKPVEVDEIRRAIERIVLN